MMRQNLLAPLGLVYRPSKIMGSVIGYVKEIEAVEARLRNFYNGCNRRFKKHKCDMDRARHSEYVAIANHLLGMIGGTAGRKKDDCVPVLIGICLGQFSSKGCPTSLHSIFLGCFIKLVSNPD